MKPTTERKVSLFIQGIDAATNDTERDLFAPIVWESLEDDEQEAYGRGMRVGEQINIALKAAAGVMTE